MASVEVCGSIPVTGWAMLASGVLATKGVLLNIARLLQFVMTGDVRVHDFLGCIYKLYIVQITTINNIIRIYTPGVSCKQAV